MSTSLQFGPIQSSDHPRVASIVYAIRATRLRVSLAALLSLCASIGTARADAIAIGEVNPKPLVSDQPVSVGTSMPGQVRLTRGSMLRSPILEIASQNSSSYGDVSVAGVGTSWVVDSALYVGSGGIGRLEVTEGGFVQTRQLNAANSIFGFAEIELAGRQSLLRVLGSADLARQGFAEVIIRNGASLDAAGSTMSLGARGRITLDDGLLRVGSLFNQGHLSGSGYVLPQGSVVNEGTIDVGAGEHMTLENKFQNRGQLSITEGSLTHAGFLFNEAGTIELVSGTMNFLSPSEQSGLENYRLLLASGEDNRIVGQVRNTKLGKMVVTSGSELDIFGDVINSNGVFWVQSGASARIVGDFVDQGGTLLAEIGGSSSDIDFGTLEVLGDIRMGGGRLRLTLADAYTPTVGDQFQIAKATGEITGEFGLPEVPELSDGLAWRFSADSHSLFASVGLPGDFNGDLTVDLADYAVWRDSQGSTGGFLAADASGEFGTPDGMVDAWDYKLWKQNFGLTAASASLSPLAVVPEPSALVLLAIGLAAMNFRRRPQR